ncbi:Short-chain dehydrogenase/reductase SDR [Penicillium canescens]|uniref:Short-chain dehydrogenase/reductase SDR n=1 Tax=Penicillium canescens TaxID=5083 RepID=A0AAD6N8S1_PENCN|nr:Short-chain dehydrogenase/reductase SDR [Penicillium canescens]KAJ5997679.1 Short-chain dehydrogenase/reductase SDR [Penicillium canescens]KAJ6043498.1 Short-chain dehydrogenase/reductase SDR [Penicillium canescens]KAJ6054974.1 Short-chain dehydrogenase/reductase SDR [Penicillium canescens]KAJ6073921.1 Short-chain dehydrogenase/reductase SDR [Penicillium canescens]KAJ6081051.1 Short-chain dehydrogenase/reductase SDR [Penicillium canescens]
MSTILISGADKGIGRGLVAEYFSRDNVTVIAAVRNPTSPETTFLSNLWTGKSSRLRIIKLTPAPTPTPKLQWTHYPVKTSHL